MENNNLNFYKQSTNAPIINLILSIIISSIIIFFFSYYYSLIITYLPLVYLNILLVLLFGYSIFLIGNSINRLFKIRNRKRALVSIIILSFLGFYFQWINYFYIISHEEITLFIKDWDLLSLIFLSPKAMLDYIIEINKNGAWEMFSFPIKGIILWGIWFLELLLIVLMAYFSYLKSKIDPFSDENNNWYVKNTIDVDFEQILLKKNFIDEFKEDAFKAISSLKQGYGTRYSKIYIYTSKGSKSLISIENIIVTNQGRGNKEHTTIIEPCYIKNSLLNEIKDKYKLRKPEFFDFIKEIYA